MICLSVCRCVVGVFLVWLCGVIGLGFLCICFIILSAQFEPVLAVVLIIMIITQLMLSSPVVSVICQAHLSVELDHVISCVIFFLAVRHCMVYLPFIYPQESTLSLSNSRPVEPRQAGMSHSPTSQFTVSRCLCSGVFTFLGCLRQPFHFRPASPLALDISVVAARSLPSIC